MTMDIANSVLFLLPDFILDRSMQRYNIVDWEQISLGRNDPTVWGTVSLM